MHRIVKSAVAANLILALIFLYTSFSLWNSVNAGSPYLIASHWSPLGIIASHYVLNENGFVTLSQTLYSYFNTPFWIFWVMVMANLYFIFKLQSSKDTKPN